MKKIFGSLGSFIGVVTAFLLIIISILTLPKMLQKPVSYNNHLPSNAYPPPDVTQESTPPDPTPFETPAVTITYLPTINPLTPVAPEGWPTDQPWPPPTSTAEPAFTPEIELFPTPQFIFVDEGVSAESLDSLWVPSRKGKNAKVELDEVLIDDKGKRKEFPKTKHVLNFGIASDYPRITSLHVSRDNKYIAYMESEREGGVWKITDISSGESLPDKKFGINLIDFYGWSPNGKFFLAYLAENDPNTLTRSTSSLINLNNGDRINMHVQTWDGVPPSINDMEFSPDGSTIADVVSYQPWSDKNNPYAVEIGIWENGDASSRKVLCRVENGTGAQQDSLKWSPDGKKLLWAGGLASPDQDEFVNWLWLADITTGKCEPVIKMGIHGPGIWVAGGFSADWSPDSKQIAFCVKEDNEEENTHYLIMLLDVQSKEVKEVIRSTENTLSNIQFSPFGDLVLYNVSGKEYGEIWAVNLISDELFPVAGPTTLFAPFEWRKNQK